MVVVSFLVSGFWFVIQQPFIKPETPNQKPETRNKEFMLLEGKTGIVFGVANKRSLAWAIARRAAEEGARIALTYQGERLEENAKELAASLKEPLVLPCDVSRDEDIAAVFLALKQEFGSLDFVVHGIAYALREELEGDYLNTSRDGYRVAQDVSVYSLTAIAREAAALLEGRGGRH